MRLLLIPVLSLGLVGCAIQPGTTASVARSPLLPPVVVAVPAPTKRVETRYDVRGYRDAASPAKWHEAHAVYRRTRVPNSAGECETLPRESLPPVSIVPLPASEELAAELSTQRVITVELRAMQAALADAQQKMRTQYATLVRESADAVTLRRQLEAERERIRHAVQVENAPGAPTNATSGNEDVKW